MLPTIKLNLRHVYGRDLYYPANIPAERFAELTESKTFNQRQLDLIQSLGFKLEINPYTGESQ